MVANDSVSRQLLEQASGDDGWASTSISEGALDHEGGVDPVVLLLPLARGSASTDSEARDGKAVAIG
jgi:hypothetical protein